MNTATLSTVEAGRMLGRQRQTIANWCRSGKIQATIDPVTGAFAIPKSELEPFVQRGLVRAEIKIERLLLTVEEAAFQLNVSKKDVEGFMHKGDLAYFAGPPLRVPTDALRAFIESKTISRKTRGRI